MAADTGFSSLDAQSDFSRARRRQVLSRLSARLRREPDDVDLILPFDEVVRGFFWDEETLKRGAQVSGATAIRTVKGMQ